jgi:hypothetical protein
VQVNFKLIIYYDNRLKRLLSKDRFRVSRGFTLWLIGAFLAVVKRMREENALISYGFSLKPSGVAAGKTVSAFISYPI